MIKEEKLLAAVMEFMKITYQCYTGTNYADDRVAFQSDIALCAKWILDIDNNNDIQKTIEDILDSSTVKHILDYYKQGKFGDEQAAAFEKFKKEVEAIKSI